MSSVDVGDRELRVESQLVMTELEGVRSAYDTLVDTTINAVQAELTSLSELSGQLLGKLANEIGRTLGASAEQLKVLENLRDTAIAMSQPIAEGSRHDEIEDLIRDLPFRGFQSVDDFLRQPKAMTFKELLWLTWRQYTACVVNERLRGSVDVDAQCRNIKIEAWQIESARSLAHLEPTIPTSNRPITAIRVPRDYEIVIRDQDGKVIM